MSRFDLTGESRDLGVDEGDVLLARSEIHHERAQRADSRLQHHHDTGGPTFDRSHGSQRGMHHDFAWVNGRPKAERSFLLRAAPAFDKDRTPADPDVGVLAEVFRQLPGTLVNDHPDGRFGARGRRSAAVLQDPLPWDDYYGPGSTLERLVMAGAKILRLGADPDTSRCFTLPSITLSCASSAGYAVTTRSWCPMGRRPFGLSLAGGRAVVGRVGDARAELIDAADFVQHGVW